VNKRWWTWIWLLVPVVYFLLGLGADWYTASGR
jgi:hypothetical protein